MSAFAIVPAQVRSSGGVEKRRCRVQWAVGPRKRLKRSESRTVGDGNMSQAALEALAAAVKTALVAEKVRHS